MATTLHFPSGNSRVLKENLCSVLYKRLSEKYHTDKRDLDEKGLATLFQVKAGGRDNQVTLYAGKNEVVCKRSPKGIFYLLRILLIMLSISAFFIIPTAILLPGHKAGPGFYPSPGLSAAPLCGTVMLACALLTGIAWKLPILPFEKKEDALSLIIKRKVIDSASELGVKKFHETAF